MIYDQNKIAFARSRRLPRPPGLIRGLDFRSLGCLRADVGGTAMRAWSSVAMFGAAVAVAFGLSGHAFNAAAAGKYKIYLSMSYVGNDWQTESANNIKAMAESAGLKDKVSLEVQVAGPNAERQIQQINAMVQAGAQ